MQREYTRTGRTFTATVAASPAAATLVSSARDGRVKIMLQNAGTGRVYYGFTSAVTPATGVIMHGGLGAGDGLGASREIAGYTGDVWMIGAAGGGDVDVRVEEVGE